MPQLATIRRMASFTHGLLQIIEKYEQTKSCTNTVKPGLGCSKLQNQRYPPNCVVKINDYIISFISFIRTNNTLR
jgi:hypothetical protein